jgi:cholesterol transport system auxiliary component
MIMTRRHAAMLIGLAPALSACGSLVDLPGKGPGAAIYDLRGAVPVKGPVSGPVLNIQLAVAEPVADRALDSDHIALAPTDRRIDYYAGVRWSDRVPSLVQTLMLAALENAGRLKAVGRPGGMLADVALAGEIRQFEAVGTNRPMVTIGMAMRLITQPSGRVIASQNFSGVVAAESASIDAVVAAFEANLRQTMASIIAWVPEQLASKT